jgi:hypothetical protein
METLGGLSDFAIGAIVVGALLVGALIAGTSGPSGKEVSDEARKKLVGKLADDRANAQHAAIKAGGAAMKNLLLAAVIVGIVAWLVVKNQDDQPLTPSIATTTTVAPSP